MPHQIAIRIIAVSVSTNIVPRLTTGGRKFKFFFFVISLLMSKCGRYHVKRNANRYILLWWSFYFLKCHSTTLHPAGKKQSKQWMTSVRDVFVIFQRWLMFLFNFNFGFLGKETFKQALYCCRFPRHSVRPTTCRTTPFPGNYYVIDSHKSYILT